MIKFYERGTLRRETASSKAARCYFFFSPKTSVKKRFIIFSDKSIRHQWRHSAEILVLFGLSFKPIVFNLTRKKIVQMFWIVSPRVAI